MNNPPNQPGQPDPNAFTQPMPPVQPAQWQQPVTPQQPYQGQPYPGMPAQGKLKKQKLPKPPPGPYQPVFGNWFVYAVTRSLAFAVDFALVPFVVATFTFEAYDKGSLLLAPRSMGGFAALLGFSYAIAFAFALLSEALVGTTFGKALFALGVRRNNGQHPGFGRAIVRYVLLPLDMLLIGPILMLLPPRHQRLGDFATGSVVARNRIGIFATIVSAVLLGGLVYAQFAVGGGITSAIGVLAETSAYAPALGSQTARTIGLGSVVPYIPAPGPMTSPEAGASLAPAVPQTATAAPVQQPLASAVPGGAATAAPAVATAAPQVTSAASATVTAPTAAAVPSSAALPSAPTTPVQPAGTAAPG